MVKVHDIDKQGGYSFMQHGGMWVDAIVIVPLVAWLTYEYRFEYSVLSIITLIVIFIVWMLLAVFIYAPMGREMPEAHAHGGYVSITGWLHVVFATIMMWFIVMTYFGMTTTHVSSHDIIATSILLMVWAYFGIMKFNPFWHFKRPERAQVLTLFAVIGIVTIWCL